MYIEVYNKRRKRTANEDPPLPKEIRRSENLLPIKLSGPKIGPIREGGGRNSTATAQRDPGVPEV
jgi:hypothetical protein